jgi:hypothetical protein
MAEQQTSGNCGDNGEREQQEIRQTKPSHMNQGNQTFIPDKQRNQIKGDHRDPQSEQTKKERSPKAS